MSPRRQAVAPGQKSKNFKASFKRLIRSLKPDWLLLTSAIGASALTVATSVAAPKIMGRGTDLIFNGVVSQMIDKAPSKEAAVAGLRAQGNDTLADMLSAMDVTPGSGIDFTALAHVLAWVCALYVVSALASYLGGWFTRTVVQNTGWRLRDQVQSKIERLPLSYLDRHSRGDLMSRVSNDVDNLTQVLTQSLSQFFQSVLMVLGILGMMLSISWKLTLFAMIVIPIGLVLAGISMKKAQPHFIAQWSSTGKVSDTVEEAMTGHEVVTLYGLEDRFTDQFNQENSALYGASFKAQFISNLVMPLMSLISNASYVIVAAGGGLMVANGQMTLGNVQAFIQYSRQFTQPLGQLAAMVNSLQSGVASAERIFDFLDAEEMEPDRGALTFAEAKARSGRNLQARAGFEAEPDVEAKGGSEPAFGAGADSGTDLAARARFEADGSAESDSEASVGTPLAVDSHADPALRATEGPNTHASNPGNGSMAASAGPGSASSQERVAGRIQFDHVRFSYEPGKPIIKDLSLSVEPGHMVAIIGPTGAGKTTLVNLLMRFYEIDSGSITIDGVDIKDLNRSTLREHVGMVLQDTWLFDGTIEQNIAFGREGASHEDVVAAARKTACDRLIRQLPQGYNTHVSDEGDAISAGERQLLTIARAFVSEPDLLILDEATSSVDTRTEVLVQKAMDQLRQGRTAFVIAHRLSTIRDADVIMVMEDGDVVETGRHQELLDRGGAYARLYQAQFAGPGAEQS